MSQKLIGRSDDLRRLRDEGYGVSVAGDGALVVHPVPFLDAHGEVCTGALVCDLDVAGDRTTKPRSHVAYFAGGTPHDARGQKLTGIINSEKVETKGGWTTSHILSSKPGPSGYDDYYVKMSTYATAIASHAEALDPEATPRCFPPVLDDHEQPFRYVDTASSRAGVDTNAFRDLSIGIVGLGGTGVYVLDLVAKTPVKAIGCYDGDVLLQHNAFRAPGVVTMEQLEAAPNKAEHWTTAYGHFRRGLTAFPYRIDTSNVGELTQYDFVFVCVDDNDTRELVANTLVEAGIPFIDTGMGLYRTDEGQLGGIIRTTTATPDQSDHLASRLPRGGGDEADEYNTNIQIADLNALNATLAVVKWKKIVRFYADQENEHESGYMLAGNCIVNEDRL